MKQKKGFLLLLMLSAMICTSKAQATIYSTIITDHFSIETVNEYITRYWAGNARYDHHVCYKYDGGSIIEDEPETPAWGFYCNLYTDDNYRYMNQYVFLRCESANPHARGPDLQDTFPVCPGTVLETKNLGDTCQSGLCRTAVANPVNPATGNKYQIEQDYSGSGPFPLRFSRFYNSDPAVVSARLGAHWRGSYDRSIEAIDNSTIRVHRADGRIYEFRYYNFQWNSEPDVALRVITLADTQENIQGWKVILTDDSIETYDTAGKLASVTRRDGLRQTLAYGVALESGGDGNPETLDTVTGPFGRTLRFAYDSFGRLSILTDPAGAEYIYNYNAGGNLESVIYPDDTPAVDIDNPVRSYHYEDQVFPHALTGITDERGNRFATWAYDMQGRAVLSEHAGGANRVRLTFNPDGTTTVRESLGQEQIYSFHIDHGLVQIKQIEGLPCSDCAESAQALTYDANGFISSRTDFNGNVTTYVHNERGLEISRTEAAGTPVARTITTEWHPDFRLPVKIKQPGRITTYTYNSHGRLLEHSMEAAQ